MTVSSNIHGYEESIYSHQIRYGMKTFTNEETLSPVPVINRAANHLDKIHYFSLTK